MRRIGILGGTFNPPHTGHLVIANEVLSMIGLDKVWFMPNQEPPHKTMAGNTTSKDRLAMLKLAIEGNPGFCIETIELERKGPSYTHETMKVLSERHPDCEFYFIIGADMVEYLPKWKNIDELVELVKFVGINRPSYRRETQYDIQSVNTPLIDISSSDIRKRLKEKRTVRYLIPEPVRRYIEENGLYDS
ncbi:nicotinate-nucleotide adenylyltransferase [Mesobacillus zeae]|uniref:Probable nicotinate-nucleotide adenylyltransferase n=1 Tax=Mesobacillus zeae TaxID=1917180 RepID=A0A398B1R3_9BACI|nr:nicotinate-nucleotide adenylyltransferase [Mesobacillus zeae]RID83775.1 nicotinate-nucleotide adenylyltransferase [Mesobacillus zeae]